MPRIVYVQEKRNTGLFTNLLQFLRLRDFDHPNYVQKKQLGAQKSNNAVT